MGRFSIRALGPAAALLALGACGGGSGGESATQAFTGAAALPSNGTVVLEGEAVTATYVETSSGRSAIAGLQRGPATLALRYRDDALSAVSAAASGQDATVNCTAAASDCFVSGGALFLSEGDTEIIAVNSTLFGFEYQTFGVWSAGETAGTVGAISAGSVTPDTTRLPSGATYTGASIGVANTAARDEAIIASVEIATDFRTARFDARDSVAIELATGTQRSARELDLSGTLAVSGTALAGGVGGAATNGDITGRLYGPAAEEIGGTFRTQGASGVYFGSFGAAR